MKRKRKISSNLQPWSKYIIVFHHHGNSPIISKNKEQKKDVPYEREFRKNEHPWMHMNGYCNINTKEGNRLRGVN